MTDRQDSLVSTTGVIELSARALLHAAEGAADVAHDNVVLLLPGVQGGETAEPPLVVRLQEALDASDEMIMVVEPCGRVLFANRASHEQLGLDPQDSVFRAIETLLVGPRRDDVWASLENENEWRGDLSTSRTDGSTIHLELTLLADRTQTGDIHSVTVIARDVGEQLSLKHALEHRSTHDGLTGLATRQHLLNEINDMLPGLAERGMSSALLLVDIDEFRTVTNSLGHEAGDRVLVAFAYRLLRTFNTSSVLARVGGDEFAIFCPGESDPDELAEQLARTTAAPFFIDGTEVHLSVGAGIATASAKDPTQSGEALLRQADAASHRGKERGRGTFEAYEDQLQTEAVDRLSIGQDLRRALRNDELRVLYQPKISLETGKIVGAEALMRWETPDGEEHGPAMFIDVAEDTGLIIPMGRWILQEVCKQAVVLQELAPESGFEVSINLSVRQLDHPTFPGDVEDAIVDSGIDPHLIELEITESALMRDVETSASLLSALKKLGTRIAVDDFGTGYSSLQYLQRLPVDILKVDQTFVAGVEETDGDRAIVVAVIQLAQALGFTSVAEGVETPGQLQYLRRLGCNQAQGYHMARPMTAEALLELQASDPSF